jgi:hypothetical protein
MGVPYLLGGKMEPYSWTCPFCNQPTTITYSDTRDDYSTLQIANKHDYKYLFIRWIVCPNKKCKEFSLIVQLYDYKSGSLGNLLKHWNLIPPSRAKVFPDYIPEALRKDYLEACLIEELSPKASATLARRCLQGMIRDFWKVSKRRLIDEINAIKNKVDPNTWKAIDAVRKVGNIGAHMEKDINLIVDVEPKEASLLINLIETLMKEWYIHRHEREAMLEDIINISKEKNSKKKENQAQQSTQQSEENKSA